MRLRCENGVVGLFGNSNGSGVDMGGETIADIRVSVARIEEKIDGLNRKFDDVLRVTGDHENRMRRVERAGYVAMGLAIAGGGAAGAFSSMITGA